MEQQILNELHTIKILAWVILLLAFICASILVIGVVGRNLGSVETLKRDSFVSDAKGLEDRGEYERLITLAASRIEDYPKDVIAWYYLAIARLRSKNYQGALEALGEIQSIDPHWEKDAIQEYLDEVRESMQGPSHEST
tara:strand:- start:285 stop:701 length:417 start_codon:yes stop_codon:yes gene_type:complete